MDRRASKRIYGKLRVRFFYDDTMYTGIISNLSENGMYIELDTCLYFYKSNFNVQLMLTNESLDIPVKISRVADKHGFYYGMGVELLDPPKQYLDFVACLGFSLNSPTTNTIPDRIQQSVFLSPDYRGFH